MPTPEPSPFFDFRWGVERETHRMLPEGGLSRRAHPAALAAPAFTRDFAEGQLEIVTAPAGSLPELRGELARLTRRAQAVLAPELLWPFSMPPRLPADEAIAVAQFPDDPRATRYREGLALRYGKARQMICGLHLNVSFGPELGAWLARSAPLGPEEDSFALRLARNLYGELATLMPLLGASPVREGAGSFQVSHRNGGSGYAGQGFLPYLELGSLPAHLAGIRRGLATLSTEFAALGLVRDGRVLQLNGQVFQAEKEFYAPIRLRQLARPGETGLQALARRGPGYLELRFLDVDPFSFTGIGNEALQLLHLFLLEALASPSGPGSNARLREDLRRAAAAAMADPLQLEADGLLPVAARLAALEGWAERLDGLAPGGSYRRVLESYRARVANPQRLPSATLARAFLDSGLSWTDFGMRTAHGHLQGVSHALDHTGI